MDDGQIRRQVTHNHELLEIGILLLLQANVVADALGPAQKAIKLGRGQGGLCPSDRFRVVVWSRGVVHGYAGSGGGRGHGGGAVDSLAWVT